MFMKHEKKFSSPQKLENQSANSASEEMKTNTDNKMNSVMIVFNTWNAMIGCGTVTIPWAF